MDTPDQTSEGGSSRDKLISDLKLVLKDAEELLRSTGQQMGSRYQSAREKFGSTLDSTKNNLGTVQTRVTTGSKDAMATTDRYVQANPWQAVGIGALAGLLIGILVARK
jgi:ElaB/YqjD/DUF883 family membrane-anchored ribosome-binding protein